MQRMSKFHKVSYSEFEKSFPLVEDKELVMSIYNSIKLPKRATYMSAGYDFFVPMSFTLKVGETIKIPTGIRCEMYDGWVLMIYPRSGLGFKYGLGLANHTGIIDGDYFEADNEGHIFVKLTNNSPLAQDIHFNAGDAFAQGVFIPFGITLDDNVDVARHGGLGSTDA